jgi:hypothetical protein
MQTTEPNIVELDSMHDTSTGALMLNADRLELLYRAAEMMASARVTIPKHLAGSPGDCLAVIMQATQWGMNPFAVAQKTHLVNGVLGYEAQLVNAVVSSRAPVTGRIEYEWYGPWERVLGKFNVKKSAEGKEYRTPSWTAADEEGCGVRVWATFRGEQQPRVLDLLLTQARTRNSTLWADDPRQQLAYLAVKRWARLYCPDVILGVYSPDELESLQPKDMGMADVVPLKPVAAKTSRADRARDALARKAPALPPPSLDLVLGQIGAAASIEALAAAGDVAAKLERDDDKARARAAYKDRLAELQAPPPDTAPAPPPAGEHDDFIRELDGE